MATVRPRVMKMPARNSRRRGVLQEERVTLREEDVPTKVLDFKPLEMRSRLEDAEIIVTGGRGVGSARNFDLIHDLAAAQRRRSLFGLFVDLYALWRHVL